MALETGRLLLQSQPTSQPLNRRYIPRHFRITQWWFWFGRLIFWNLRITQIRIRGVESWGRDLCWVVRGCLFLSCLLLFCLVVSCLVLSGLAWFGLTLFCFERDDMGLSYKGEIRKALQGKDIGWFGIEFEDTVSPLVYTTPTLVQQHFFLIIVFCTHLCD